MDKTEAPSPADRGSGSNDQLGPTAWALTAFGRVQKIVMRADVADELACKWRESDPEATAVPLYTWAAVEAHRQPLTEMQIQELCCAVDASGARPAATALIRAVEQAHGIGA